MDDTANRQTDEQEKLSIELKTKDLNRQLRTVTQKISTTNEERKLEDRDIQQNRARQDAILASNRRKEDAIRALKRISQNEEYRHLKEAITQKLVELQLAQESATCRSSNMNDDDQDRLVQLQKEKSRLEFETDRLGPFRCSRSAQFEHHESDRKELHETIDFPSSMIDIYVPSNAPKTYYQPVSNEMSMAKPVAAPLSEERHVSFNLPNSHKRLLKQFGMELKLPSGQDSEMRKEEVSENNPSIGPDTKFPVLGDLSDVVGEQSQRVGIRGSSSELLSQSLAQPSSLEIALLPCSTFSDRFNTKGSLSAIVGSHGKRRASSPIMPDVKNPSIQDGKKRAFVLNSSRTQNVIKREFRPLLKTATENQPASFGQFNDHSKELMKTSKLSDIPSKPRPSFRTGAIQPRAMRRLLECSQDSGIFFSQTMMTRLPRTRVPVLIMHNKEQIHAPYAEGSTGTYYTLIEPLPTPLTHFPVLVCTKALGVYQYVGNYKFKNSQILRDNEVDQLGPEICHALVMSQIMKAQWNKPAVVRRDAVDPLLRCGVVRTEREAKRVMAKELVARMKHIKLTPKYNGKPVGRMPTFANRLVYHSFETDYFTRYF